MNNIINNIINECTLVKEQTKEGCYGCYLRIKTNELHNEYEPFRKTLLTCFKAGRQILRGESYEIEDIMQYTLQFYTEALTDVFNGEHNNKLETELHINTNDDIIRIINSEQLVNQLLSYLYTIVVNKLRSHVNTDHPDYIVTYEDGKRKFNPLDKISIDAELNTNEKATTLHDILAANDFTPSTGELTKYILSTYYSVLTKKQQQWVDTVLQHGFAKDGSTYDYNNNLLYTVDQNYQYRKSIEKRLLPWIETDQHVNISYKGSPRWILK